MKILQQRDTRIIAMDKELLKLGGDAAKHKKMIEELRKNKKKISVKCEKLEYTVDDQKSKLVRLCVP